MYTFGNITINFYFSIYIFYAIYFFTKQNNNYILKGWEVVKNKGLILLIFYDNQSLETTK